MPGNSFGTVFRITTCGESHGGAVGVIVDGCPSGIALSEADIQPELDRRKPGQSAITSPRAEKDTIHIFSGVCDGVTTGAPILLLAHNDDVRSQDYLHMKDVFRPSHADYTYQAKYGVREWRGSGRASARETLARVAAGAIAKKFLSEKEKIEVVSFVQSVGEISAAVDAATVSRDAVDANIIRCPDPNTAKEMIALVEHIRDEGDSIGGVIGCVIRNVPAGLGEPVFDKLHADLGKAMLSINAVKGFEIGSGFAGTRMRGSHHNDPLVKGADERIHTSTNHAGGIVGGISNGEPITFRVAFKPVATIRKEQQTVSVDGSPVTLKASGRHDPCVLPRAVPIVDAMAYLVLMEHYLRQKTVRI